MPQVSGPLVPERRNPLILGVHRTKTGPQGSSDGVLASYVSFLNDRGGIR